MIGKIINLLNIDSSTFWTLVVTGIIPLLLRLGTKYENIKENKYYTVPKKMESDMFYAWIMLYAVFVGFCLFFAYTVLSQSGVRCKELQFIILLGLLYSGITFIDNRCFVRKRLLNSNRRKRLILINLPILFFSGIIMIGIFAEHYVNMARVLSWCFFICEVAGLIVFEGRYTKYEYSNANIYLKNGEVLQNINAEMIYQGSKWLIVKKDRGERRIKVDEIVSIEYFGEAVIIMRKSVLESLKKLVKTIKGE